MAEKNTTMYKRPMKYGPFVCGCCGKQYMSNRSDTDKYCSRECAFTYKRENSTPKYCQIYTNTCLVCGSVFIHRRVRKACSDQCSKKQACVLARVHNINKQGIKPMRECAHCGKAFVPEYGNQKRVFCSSECGNKHARALGRKRYGTTYRKRSRIYQVEYEPVNRLLVFERDGWKCQICGKPTPSKLMGTMKHNAPELDHRIPMSKGGAHSYDNTQCSCRKCNGTKGNSTETGQIPLFEARQ